MASLKSFAVVLGIALLLMGCAAQPASAPSGSPDAQAPVQSVKIVQSMDGAELTALVKGALPDGCARLGDAAVTPGGSLIVVILPVSRDSAAKNCGGAAPYERAIPLGSNLPPGQYTVSVNGVQATFTLQGTAPTAAPSAAPTTTRTATQPAAANAPTESPQPTATATAAPGAPTPTATSANAGAATPTLAPTPTQAAPAGASTACVNKAAFFADVSVPDGSTFDPAQKFTKTWRVRNAGTCTWSGYTLAYQDGDPLGSASPAQVPGSTAPGDTVDISVAMTAPQTAGSYYSDWLLVAPGGATFGMGAAGDGLLWTRISVRTLVPSGAGKPVCAFQTDPSVEAQLLQMINEARQQANLPALKLVDAISTAARGHSQDMACNDFVEHYGSDGSTWFGRLQAQGVKYGSANENIYAGNPQFGGDATGAFAWWMNSKVHHDNIMNPASTEIGIGYVFYASSTYKAYYTLDFAGPK